MNSPTHRLRTAIATTLLATSTLTGITGLIGAPAAHATVTTGSEIVQFGDNAWGETGDGTALGTQWKAIDADDNHTLALRNDGTVWAWGRNNICQLGNNTTTNSTTPVQVVGPGGVGFLTGITSISAGGDHSLARRSDGTVWAWGSNVLGQLGNNSLVSFSCTPVQVKGPGGVGFLTGITQVSASGNHSLARKSDGTVWAWGYNGLGQLGNNTTTNSSTPVQVTGPGGVGFLTGITQVSAGAFHSLARKSDGTVWAWGDNFFGQLGINTFTNSSAPVQVRGFGGSGFLTGITQVSAGGAHSLARRSDGTVWAWGYNFSSQLGNNTFTNSSTPVQVVGSGGFGFLTGITQVSAGGAHSLARKSDGTVWAWGYNFYGQLGNNTTNSSTPVQVASITRATSVSAGGNHSEVLRAASLVATPGTIAYGTLRTNTTATTGPITITNTDTIPVTVNAITTTGTDATAFDPIATALPTTLAPGGSITISTITATTDATPRTYAAQLLVDTDQPEPLTVPITLRAVDPTWTLGPAPSAFGTVAIGTTSASATVSVTNTSLVPIGSIVPAIVGTNPADFAVLGSTCGATLAAGKTCVVDVVARPTALGARTAALRVASDAGTFSVPLAATGANSADLGVAVTGPSTGTAGTAFADTITVVSYGPAVAKNVAVTVTLSAGGSYTSISGSGWSCPGGGLTRVCTRLSLAVGASATITVNASFPAGAQSVSATISGASTLDPDPSDNAAARNTTVS